MGGKRAQSAGNGLARALDKRMRQRPSPWTEEALPASIECGDHRLAGALGPQRARGIVVEIYAHRPSILAIVARDEPWPAGSMPASARLRLLTTSSSVTIDEEAVDLPAERRPQLMGDAFLAFDATIDGIALAAGHLQRLVDRWTCRQSTISSRLAGQPVAAARAPGALAPAPPGGA